MLFNGIKFQFCITNTFWRSAVQHESIANNRVLSYIWASQVGQPVKSPPTMQETLVQFLGWEVPLEKG